MLSSHQCCVMREVICKEITTGGRFDSFLDSDTVVLLEPCFLGTSEHTNAKCLQWTAIHITHNNINKMEHKYNARRGVFLSAVPLKTCSFKNMFAVLMQKLCNSQVILVSQGSGVASGYSLNTLQFLEQRIICTANRH